MMVQVFNYLQRGEPVNYRRTENELDVLLLDYYVLS